MEVVHQEGSAPSEVHEMCVCSTLYCTQPNMPSTSGEYQNESRRYSEAGSPLAWHDLITRP